MQAIICAIAPHCRANTPFHDPPLRYVLRSDHLASRAGFSPLHAGFADDGHIAHRLNMAFKACSRSKDGHVTFPEFFAAAARLGLVAPTQQERCIALFERYSADGDGRMNYERFSTALLGIVPNAEATPAIRTACAAYRKSASRVGPATVLDVVRALQAAGAASQSGFLSRREAQRILLAQNPEATRWDVHAILGEAARPYPEAASVKAQELALMVRGSLTRSRREVIDEAWARLTASKGRAGVTVEDVAPGLGSRAAASAHLPSSPSAPVSWPLFLEVIRGVSAATPSDEEFENMMEAAYEGPEGAGAGAGATVPPQLPGRAGMGGTVSFSETVGMAATRGGGGGAGQGAAARAGAGAGAGAGLGVYGRTAAGARAVPELPGSPLTVFRGVAEGRVRYEPGLADRPELVGACLRNTLGRAVPLLGRETQLGRPQRVVQNFAGAAFGAGAQQAVPVGTMLIRGVEMPGHRDGAGGGAAAAAESIRWTGTTKGLPPWRHNKAGPLSTRPW
jgi:hypothetical protein